MTALVGTAGPPALERAPTALVPPSWRQLALRSYAAGVMVLGTGAGFAVLDAPTGIVQQALWLTAYGVAGAVLVDGLLRRRMPVPAAPGALIVVAVAAASTLWSGAPTATVQSVVGLAGTLVVALALAQRLTPAEVLDAVRHAGTLIAVMSLALYAAGDGRVLDPTHGTLRGVLVAKNSLGQVLAVALVVTALTWSRWPSRWPWLLASAAPMALALALTDSATAVLITAAGAAAALALRLRAAHPLSLPGAVCIGVALLAAASLLGPGLQVGELAGAVGRDTTLTGRTEIWPVAVDAVRAEPVLGYGYGAFWDSAAAEAARLEIGFAAAHAHNGVLDVALETGALGLAALALLVGSVVAAGLRDRRHGRGDSALLRLGVVALLAATNAVESGLLDQHNPLTVLLLAAAALPRVDRRTARAERERRRTAARARRLRSLRRPA
jgi:exopolysaccharide production protein ExoQ